MIERLCSEKFEEGKSYRRHTGANFIRKKGDFVVQYKCNPHPINKMMKFPEKIENFRLSTIEINGFVYSYEFENIETGITYHRVAV